MPGLTKLAGSARPAPVAAGGREDAKPAAKQSRYWALKLKLTVLVSLVPTVTCCS
jgi:hypothetical protein